MYFVHFPTIEWSNCITLLNLSQNIALFFQISLNNALMANFAHSLTTIPRWLSLWFICLIVIKNFISLFIKQYHVLILRSTTDNTVFTGIILKIADEIQKKSTIICKIVLCGTNLETLKAMKRVDVLIMKNVSFLTGGKNLTTILRFTRHDNVMKVSYASTKIQIAHSGTLTKTKNKKKQVSINNLILLLMNLNQL